MSESKRREETARDAIESLSKHYNLDWGFIANNTAEIMHTLRVDDIHGQANGVPDDDRMYGVARLMCNAATDGIDAFIAEKGGVESTVYLSGVAFMLKELAITMAAQLRLVAIKHGHSFSKVPTEEQLVMIMAVCALFTREGDPDAAGEIADDPMTQH